MRIARTLSLLFLLPLLAAPGTGCRGLLVGEDFRAPKARLVDVEPDRDAGKTLSGGPLRLLLVLEVANPNRYPLSLSRIAYSGHLGTIRVAEGEHTGEVTLPAEKAVLVRAPVAVLPSALKEALLRTLVKRSADYELDGCLGVKTPLLGVVQVPFSLTGRIDLAQVARRIGAPLE